MESVPQVGLDGRLGDEQVLGDLPVGPSLRRQVRDLAFRAEQVRNYTQDSTTVYTLLLLMYFGMALVLMAIMKTLERAVGRWRAVARS